jgi:hypothetical protein
LLKLGVKTYSYNDHRSAAFSRARRLALAPPTLLEAWEPTLSWNQHVLRNWLGMVDECNGFIASYQFPNLGSRYAQVT